MSGGAEPGSCSQVSEAEEGEKKDRFLPGFSTFEDYSKVKIFFSLGLVQDPHPNPQSNLYR
jgi:hypothetical protein